MMNVIIQVLKKKFSESCKYVIIYFVKTYCLIFESKMGKAKQQGNKTTKFHPLFKTNERSHFSGKVNSGKKPSERPEVMGSKISYHKSIKPKSQKNLAFTFCLSQFETLQNLQWQSTGKTWQPLLHLKPSQVSRLKPYFCFQSFSS